VCGHASAWALNATPGEAWRRARSVAARRRSRPVPPGHRRGTLRRADGCTAHDV